MLTWQLPQKMWAPTACACVTRTIRETTNHMSMSYAHTPVQAPSPGSRDAVKRSLGGIYFQLSPPPPENGTGMQQRIVTLQQWRRCRLRRRLQPLSSVPSSSVSLNLHTKRTGRLALPWLTSAGAAVAGDDALFIPAAAGREPRGSQAASPSGSDTTSQSPQPTLRPLLLWLPTPPPLAFPLPHCPMPRLSLPPPQCSIFRCCKLAAWRADKKDHSAGVRSGQCDNAKLVSVLGRGPIRTRSCASVSSTGGPHNVSSVSVHRPAGWQACRPPLSASGFGSML